jgi:hypothetical protein
MSTPHPLARQVGGSHYKEHAIEPIEVSMGNKLSAAAALALKHMTRPGKGQVRADIEKTLHYLDFHEQQWPRVSEQKFVEGLSPEVPAWMRRVAWHITMLDHSMTSPKEHREAARRLLREQLAALTAQEAGQ